MIQKENLTGQILPYNKEMELAVLKYILGKKDAIYLHLNILKPNVFYNEIHKELYESIISTIRDIGDNYTLLLLYERIEKEDKRNLLRDYPRFSLFSHAFNPDSSTFLMSSDIFTNYVLILIEKWIRREHITSSHKAIKNAYNNGIDVFVNLSTHISFLEKLASFKSPPSTFKSNLDNVISKIKGEENNIKNVKYWKLYDNKLASKIRLQPNRVILFPSDKGAGKTSFITYIAEGLLELNNNIAILWFCFEDDIDDMILKFLSRRLKKSVKELKGIDYLFSEEDKAEIDKVRDKIKDYPIEFENDPCTIYEIKSKTKRFSEKFENKNIVVIIDNFGLISKKGMQGDNLAKEKDIVETINEIKQANKACILIPHHITKEAVSKNNFNDGYRVRDNHVKGAGELLNYFPQCYSIVNPGRYPDIREAYSVNNVITSPNKQLSKESFQKDLWSLNPDGNLNSTYTSLYLTVKKMETDKNGNTVDYSYIVSKYSKYINEINRINESREPKYKSKPKPISIFLEEKMYLKVNDKIKYPFDEFYYGRIKEENRPTIERLFIVEGIRDRYEQGDNLIFRYKHELEYNNFIAL